jgi:hypothetical protein
MGVDRASVIQQKVAASISHAGRLQRAISVGDCLADLGMTRIGLFAVLIELEDEFGVEFPDDPHDCFQFVGDIGFYIHARALAPYDDVTADDEIPPARSAASRQHAWTRGLAACVSALGNAFRVSGFRAAT